MVITYHDMRTERHIPILYTPIPSPTDTADAVWKEGMGAFPPPVSRRADADGNAPSSPDADQFMPYLVTSASKVPSCSSTWSAPCQSSGLMPESLLAAT